MAENIPLRVQFKRMTAEEWARSDVILLEGEIGFETDTGFAKFGNGKNQFKDLKYLQGPRGDKGDSITITDQQRVSEGVQLTFSDKTKVVIPKGEKGDVNGINLEDYVKKSELKSVDSADVKAINDFLGLSQKVFTSNYSYSDSLLKSYSNPSYSASWYVNESTKDVNVKDKVLITISNTTTRVDNYLELSVTYVGSNYVTATSTGKLLTTPGEVNVLTKEQVKDGFATKDHRHEIDDINGLQSALSHKANAQHSHSDYLEQSTADNLYLAKHELQGYLSSYVRQAEIRSLIDNIGKLKDEATGQYLSVKVVDKGSVPHNTSGMIVFERA